MISLSPRRIAINTVDYNAIELQYTGITEEDVRNYMADNPVPCGYKWAPDYYTMNDFINDLHASGVFSIPMDTPQEMVSYIEDILNDLI